MWISESPYNWSDNVSPLILRNLVFLPTRVVVYSPGIYSFQQTFEFFVDCWGKYISAKDTFLSQNTNIQRMRFEHKIRDDEIRNVIGLMSSIAWDTREGAKEISIWTMVYQNFPYSRAVQMIKVIPPSRLNLQLISDLYPLAISQDFQHLLQIVTWLVWGKLCQVRKSKRQGTQNFVHTSHTWRSGKWFLNKGKRKFTVRIK